MTRFSLIAKNLVLLLRSTERSPNASLFQAFSWLGRSAENIARKITKKARREEALSLFFLRSVFCAAPQLTERLEEPILMRTDVRFFLGQGMDG